MSTHVRPRDVIWNPLSGEKAMVVESAEGTDGARVVLDFAVEKGGFVPGGEHRHDYSREHFEVQAGEMIFLIDGEERTLVAGDQVTIEPGTWHRWWNSGADEVQMRLCVEPALRFEEMILVAWGLCADGLTNARGFPSPLYGALAATHYREEIRLRRPPDLIQRVVLPPLARLARRRGLERTLQRYLDLDTHPSAEATLGRLPDHVMRGTVRRR